MGAWYRAGTVSITSGSKNVVGVDTYFVLNASIGDIFTIDGNRVYEIETITDNTHLSLKTAYGETTVSGGTYGICRNFTSTTNATLAEKLTTLLNSWQAREDEFANWLAGTANGGTNGDGKYPLTNAIGQTQQIDCPAKIATGSFTNVTASGVITAAGCAVTGVTTTTDSTQTSVINTLTASHSSYTGSVQKLLTTRAASEDFWFLYAAANNVEQFKVTGAGVVYAKGVNITGNIKATGTIYANSNVAVGSGWQLSSLTMGYDLTNTHSWIQSGGAASANTNIAMQALGGNVLIGTTTDAGTGKLQVAGDITSSGKLQTTQSTASTVSAVLAQNPYDVNFKLGAAAGVNSGSTGTEMHRFGAFYNGQGWDSYLTFKRGSGATDGSLTISAANTEVLSISSTGLVVTGTTSTTDLNIVGGSITTAATAGSATALPALPVGYLRVYVDGAVRRIAIYQ